MAKVRNGFVTNSSSSSFIVAFDELPSSIEELQNLLFDDSQYVDYEYSSVTMTCTDAATRVFNDLKGQKPNDQEKIMDALGGYITGMPDYNEYVGLYKFDSKEYKEAVNRYNEDTKKFLKAKLARFKKLAGNRDIYVFSYADDSGEACLEHGNIFSHLPHMKVSHH